MNNHDTHNIGWEHMNLTFNKVSGLNDEEIEKSIECYGNNLITEKKKTHPFLKFLGEFTNLFSILLQIGSILCFLGYGLDTNMTDFLYLGIVLYVVVFLTSIFSFYQESKSESIMNSFKNLLPQKAKVIRNNLFTQIESNNLVVGDTIILEMGDKVNADIRLFESNDIKVDNSILTGESEPQSRKVDEHDENILESKNIVFFGTTVIEGSGKGIVIKIGDGTEMGKIANLAQDTNKVDTPIKREIKYFVKIISSIAIFLGIVFFILGIIKKTSYIINIINCIGIIVANVPEGLLATVTIILSLAAKQMADKNVLVKNLETVESLGSTSVICTDKTGTLTQNKLSVSNIIFNGEIYSHSNTPESNLDIKNYWDTFLSIGLRCNCSREITNNGKKDNIGNPTDVALKNWISSKLSLSNHYETLLEIPFDSKRKYHLKIIKSGDIVEYFLKGAYDTIINFCPKTYRDNKILDSNTKELDKLANILASEGERILGFAYKLTNYDKNIKYHSDNIENILKDLIFYGMISFTDPPRKNVPWAVSECQNAGIQVVMVTGDHPITAISIGKQVGIIQSKKDEILIIDSLEKCQDIKNNIPGCVVLGKVIPNLTKDKWDLLLEKEQLIFARTSPEQKLQIVEKFQDKGNVVAVTGDGVNDSPALKKADIGIAMGINGSDVSKETADMILLDDNFASIVKGVKEGRRVFENLKKSIAYTLSSNIPEICPFLFFIIINIPLPLTTVLILFIDLGTDMIPAISFAWEKTESDLMLQKPRKLGKDRLVDFHLINFSYLQIGILQAIAAFFTYFYVMDREGLPFYVLPGLGDDFIKKDLYCNTGITHCHFNNVTDYSLYKTKEESKKILETAHTAYFVTIIIVQIADKIICKTRRLSIFQHCYFHWGDFFGISSELILGLLVAYVPFLNTGLGTRSLKWEYWLISVPFAFYIFFYDESRRYIIRHINSNSFIYKILKW